jgi:adenylylsulfate kinase
MIYWFTGQPGCGKSTLVQGLYQHLDNPIILDGDELRELFNNKDYTEKGRTESMEEVQKLAKFLDFKGFTVLVAIVAPYRDLRERFKEEMGDRLKEYYVYTSEERGKEKYHVKGYQPPKEMYTAVDTTDDDPENTIRKLLITMR